MFPDLPADLAIRLAGPALNGAEAVLSPEERVRLAAFGHENRRRGFALGRLSARTLLADRLGCAPREVPLDVAEDGGPVLLGEDLHVSITHAGKGADTLAAAAVAARPVGIDLEAIVPRHADLHRRILRPEERPVYAALPYDPNTGQLLLWSMKEAVLKGLRTGFRRPARSLRLYAIAGGRGRAETAEGERWALRYVRHGGFWLTVAFAEAQ